MTFETLEKMYPMERHEMDFETELCFVSDCFDAYEESGFADAYMDVHGQTPEHNGMKFEIVRRLEYSTSECDLECLPMWEIRFEDGYVMDAYPEEITKIEQC